MIGIRAPSLLASGLRAKQAHNILIINFPNLVKVFFVIFQKFMVSICLWGGKCDHHILKPKHLRGSRISASQPGLLRNFNKQRGLRSEVWATPENLKTSKDHANHVDHGDQSSVYSFSLTRCWKSKAHEVIRSDAGLEDNRT